MSSSSSQPHPSHETSIEENLILEGKSASHFQVISTPSQPALWQSTVCGRKSRQVSGVTHVSCGIGVLRRPVVYLLLENVSEDIDLMGILRCCWAWVVRLARIKSRSPGSFICGLKGVRKAEMVIYLPPGKGSHPLLGVRNLLHGALYVAARYWTRQLR